MKTQQLIFALASIFIGGLVGYLTGPDTPFLGVAALDWYTLFGQLFLNALKLVVLPLVISSIITGTAKMGGDASFSTLGAKTFGTFIGVSFLAVVVGWGVVSLLSPGAHIENLTIASTVPVIQEVSGFQKIESILFKLIPSNIFAAAAEGQMLGVIGFSLLFGLFLSKINPHSQSILLAFWQGIFEVMMKVTKVIMKALPIGVFALIAKVTATTGFESLISVSWFFVTILIAFAVYLFIFLPLVLWFKAGVSPLKHYKAMGPALLTAFSTSSSAATLPVTLECIEKRANVSNRITSFVVPLGTSINMSGTALYLCVTGMYLAQVYGVDLGVGNQVVIALMSVLTSIGMAGIPSASLISAVVVLQTVGLPAEAIALVMPVERILDMFRTVVNVFGNSCCAILVARSEGEKEVLVT